MIDRSLRRLLKNAVAHPATRGVTQRTLDRPEPVDGLNPASWPRPYDSDNRSAPSSLSVARALARLGAVEHAALGLGDLARQESCLDLQVACWRVNPASCTAHEGYSGPDLATWTSSVTGWRPIKSHEWTPGLIHGAHHLANSCSHLRGVASRRSWIGRCAPSGTR